MELGVFSGRGNSRCFQNLRINHPRIQKGTLEVVIDSGEGSVVESRWFRVKIADSISGASSWLEGSSNGRASVKEVFSRIRSRRASASEVVLCMNDPPAVTSSCRADSLLSPNQKC